MQCFCEENTPWHLDVISAFVGMTLRLLTLISLNIQIGVRCLTAVALVFFGACVATGLRQNKWLSLTVPADVARRKMWNVLKQTGPFTSSFFLYIVLSDSDADRIFSLSEATETTSFFHMWKHRLLFVSVSAHQQVKLMVLPFLCFPLTRRAAACA